MARPLMFSIIIPTRNRTQLLKRALESVTSQKDSGFEVMVVNDGTEGCEKVQLDELKAVYARHVRFLDLPASPTGNGCFRVMNTGALAAWGDYLCFLDDDDEWVDPAHLADARRIIEASSPDVVVFDQEAYSGEWKAPSPIWLEDLGERLHYKGVSELDGSFRVVAGDLLTAHGFAHTNATIIRRNFFFELGGFDASLWYEGDRDFFLRWIDTAAEIRYLPKVCARHNIPEGRASMSNSASVFRKARDQAFLLHKAVKLSHQHVVISYAVRHRRYALRKAVNAVAQNPLSLEQLLWSMCKLMFVRVSKTQLKTVELARRAKDLTLNSGFGSNEIESSIQHKPRQAGFTG